MFKLRFSVTSPFVRKVLVAAIETGQREGIDLVPTATADPNSDLDRDNPLGKVPALVLADGSALYDSRVICEYLDSRHSGTKLFPAEGDARWTALRRQALADGIMDAGVLCMMEARRSDATQRSPEWVAKQKGKMAAGFDALEKEAGSFGDAFDIGHIAIACALGYADFRFGADKWRDTRPNLARWFEKTASRPSFKETVPHD